MTAEEVLFRLLKNEICGTELPMDFDVTGKEKDLYRLSRRHDLAHLIGDALLRNNLLSDDKIKAVFKKQMVSAMYRYEQQNAVYLDIQRIFNDEKIEFIPLKGLVVRDYYPKSWMRTSCDIDVLIKQNDVKRATSVLVKNGFQTDNIRHYHDYSFYFGETHLELHFTLCENNKQLDKLLSQVWDYAEQSDGFKFQETGEFFVAHHIAHMAFHFMNGGCGIRPFMDLWLLKHSDFYSEDLLRAMLDGNRLTAFYKAVCHLSEVWFGNEKHTDLSLKMQDYIIRGGVYGSSVNSTPVGIARNDGNKLKYLLKIAFLPYRNMCVFYPSLVKHKILLPFCYVHRVFIKLFGKDRKKVKGHINMVVSNSDESVANAKELLNELELS